MLHLPQNQSQGVQDEMGKTVAMGLMDRTGLPELSNKHQRGGI